jgi:hypothetical protein
MAPATGHTGLSAPQTVFVVASGLGGIAAPAAMRNRRLKMLRVLLSALIVAGGAGASFSAEKPEIRIEDLLKLFKTQIADADAMKCTKLEDALELAAIFAAGGIDALSDHKKDGCELLEDIGASNRDPSKLAKASVKVHAKWANAPVYELTGKTEFVEEDDDVTVYVLLLKPAN